MKSITHIGRNSILGVAGAAVALAFPVASSATTGIETSLPVRVVLTEQGAVWTPALSRLHPDTDTTYEIKVINRSAEPHSFKIGYRETKILPRGASQFFYYSFHLIGRTAWQAKHGNVQRAGFQGTLQVKLQKAFSGGNAG
jgi:hypothetical protein